MTERLLTAAEVAELIGMRVGYVYELSRRGRIPTITFGRTRRYRREAIEAWLAEQERPSADLRDTKRDTRPPQSGS
jgi:excisionase family DNA binding protein